MREIEKIIKDGEEELANAISRAIRKKAVLDFCEFLVEQMEKREYMGVKYKQGTFTDMDIKSCAKKFIKKEKEEE